ncbi:MAG: hypothetical protein NVS3B12_12360 [Acidimicrobiales bacterium]
MQARVSRSDPRCEQLLICTMLPSSAVESDNARPTAPLWLVTKVAQVLSDEAAELVPSRRHTRSEHRRRGAVNEHGVGGTRNLEAVPRRARQHHRDIRRP